MIGLHPTSVDENWKQRLNVIRKWLDSARRFYGIGEVGLDLYWDKTFRKEQMQALETQIQWALEKDLPLIIHCRNAFTDLMTVFEPYKDTKLHGIFHCFSGTEEEAHKLLEYDGFMLGINGVVTFKRNLLPETLKTVPLNRIVLETDSPYLAPVPYRGKRNESAYLTKIAEKLAEIYDVPTADIAYATTKNALKVFKKTAKNI